MVRLHESTEVGRSIEDCVRYLRDFSTAEQWYPGVYRARKVTPGTSDPGTEFDLVLNVAGRRMPMRYRLDQVAEGRELVLAGQAQGLTARDRIQLEALPGERTRIEWTAELSFDGPGGRFEPLLRPWLTGVGRRAARSLNTMLAVPPAPPYQDRYSSPRGCASVRI